MFNRNFKSLLFLLLLFIGQSCSQHRLEMGPKNKRAYSGTPAPNSKRARVSRDKKSVGFSKWTNGMFKKKFGFEFNWRGADSLTIQKINVTEGSINLVMDYPILRKTPSFREGI